MVLVVVAGLGATTPPIRPEPARHLMPALGWEVRWSNEFVDREWDDPLPPGPGPLPSTISPLRHRRALALDGIELGMTADEAERAFGSPIIAARPGESEWRYPKVFLDDESRVIAVGHSTELSSNGQCLVREGLSGSDVEMALGHPRKTYAIFVEHLRVWVYDFEGQELWVHFVREEVAGVSSRSTRGRPGGNSGGT